jgi:hypothetical protein
MMRKPRLSPRRNVERPQVKVAAPLVPDLPVTRRHLFQLSLLGVASGTCCAQAQQHRITKASKKVAGYVDRKTDSTQNCIACHFYLDPIECMLVEGPVSPWGTCNYFAD